jgi:hypothetical protein
MKISRASFFRALAAACSAAIARAQGVVITPGSSTFGPPTGGGVFQRPLSDTDRLDAIEKYRIAVLPGGPNLWDPTGAASFWAVSKLIRPEAAFPGDCPREAIDKAIRKLEEE